MKRAEGIVTLIVCNPNKKDDKKDEKKDEIAKTPAKSEKKGKKKRNTLCIYSIKYIIICDALGTKQKIELCENSKLKNVFSWIGVEKSDTKPKDDKPVDPSKATIEPNNYSVIEINAGGKPLGLDIMGGKMYTPPVVSTKYALLIIDMYIHQMCPHLQDGAYIVYVKPTFAADLDKRLQRLDKVTEVEGTKITAEMTEYDLKKLFKRCYLQVSIVIDSFLFLIIRMDFCKNVCCFR